MTQLKTKVRQRYLCFTDTELAILEVLAKHGGEAGYVAIDVIYDNIAIAVSLTSLRAMLWGMKNHGYVVHSQIGWRMHDRYDVHKLVVHHQGMVLNAIEFKLLQLARELKMLDGRRVLFVVIANVMGLTAQEIEILFDIMGKRGVLCQLSNSRYCESKNFDVVLGTLTPYDQQQALYSMKRAAARLERVRAKQQQGRNAAESVATKLAALETAGVVVPPKLKLAAMKQTTSAQVKRAKALGPSPTVEDARAAMAVLAHAVNPPQQAVSAPQTRFQGEERPQIRATPASVLEPSGIRQLTPLEMMTGSAYRRRGFGGLRTA